MILSDKALVAKLSEIDVECEQSHPFDAGSQVQPASIDLRLSNVFWVPRAGSTIDLLKETAVQLNPFRFWERREHTHANPVILKPGELILARVHEKLSIPRDCAGKFEGRSSYARLGLSVHCTGDFANPGYRGRMPLQLFNHGPFTLKIYPYMSICQLILFQLTTASDKKYGGDDLASKYMNDDGGPSYWWRDKYIKHLRQALSAVDFTEVVQTQVYSRLSDIDADVVERLATFIETRNLSPTQTADDILGQFAEKEDKLKAQSQNSLNIWYGLALIPPGGIIGLLFQQPINTVGIIALSLLALPLFWKCWKEYTKPRPSAFLGTAELKALPRPKQH